MSPQRIQRKRSKGWKMPPNTVSVTRPGKWGNPFVVCSDQKRLAHYANWKHNTDGWTDWPVVDAATAVKAFRWLNRHKVSCERIRDELRGKNLACWCKRMSHGKYTPCHADVLLSLANDIPMEEVISENIAAAQREAAK